MNNISELTPLILPFSIIVGVLTGSITIFTNFKKWIIKTHQNHKLKKIAQLKMPDRIEQIYDKVDNINTRLIKVEKEISPNSGSSMNDFVKLIKAEIDANNWLSPRPTFRTNSMGVNSSVNEAYCHLCGVSSDELLKLGWKSFVSDEEQADEYYKRWLLAAKELSQFSSRLKLQNRLGEDRGEWMIRLRPLGAIATESGDDYLWHGCLYPSDDVAKEYASKHNIPLI